MVRYAKKNQFEALREIKTHRSQRKIRGQRLSGGESANKQERRFGWGYAKRRHVLLGEE